MESYKQNIPISFVSFAEKLPFGVFVFSSPTSQYNLDCELIYANPLAKDLIPNPHQLRTPIKVRDLFPNLEKEGILSQIFTDLSDKISSQFDLNAELLLNSQCDKNRIYSLLTKELNETQFYFLIEEVTEPSFAEKNFRENEFKLDHVLKTMINGVVVTNLEGQIIYANESAANILSLSIDKIQNKYFSGKDWRQIREDGSPLPVDELPLAIALEKQKTVYNFEHGIVSEGEKVKWLSINAAPLFDETGKLEGATASFLDITELKNTEHTIKSQNRKLKAILDAIERSAIVSVTDKKGIIKRVNQKFIQISGYTEKELVGSDHKKLNSKFHPKEFWEKMWKDILSGHPWEGVIRNQSKLGNFFWLQTFIHPLYDSNDSIESFLSIRFNITEEVDALENTNRMLHFTGIQNSKLQNFAYIVSHNIRQHSSNFTSLIDLLEESPSEEERKNILNMLHASSDKLNETITHLNDIISINQMLNKPMETCSIEEEIQKTLYILKGSIESRNIKVYLDLEEKLELKIIPAYLESILLNLVSNAIKYVRLKNGAFIRISAKKKNYQVQLTVEDNGLGINLEKHGTKIFGMFKTFHKNEDARGIGLFITKSQVEVLGGTITVESTEGIGSTFTVFLPENPNQVIPF
ncbi:PAS domain-containing sensor histidine kinase [Leptospira sp. 2 VSF19]|uniref:histidine kinase n=1 Tax=Leptospira soteropolitanensis TaxID=2950025 RepID=A0AAW5VKP7_9LEPT|nr:PAS domain-containing sensor histidine kinase [Leptospira soteropolitanensis]MCW7493132.1 PAS domain-containing sensor histidine kinase [Leptospira soteropolitanensis]MCW7500799.1 PAS domain-containing sensor histidine kinase [Leptospira soteropolitanensis]MCW7522982.1 PAS domain-containing sensor histidine kinase [Leptospira soteropolitanensis]MCW7526911.1 PAS domain-containing sensor histidine kinase [Leptospira soteropolitanensis]MCW7530700.1 PAS domain-containing sensor histidine kinase